MRATLQVCYDSKEIKKHAEMMKRMKGDCGIDLHYVCKDELRVRIGECLRIPNGVKVKIPDGYCGFIRARSSTFIKRGLFIVEGIIDSGYVGPLYSIVWNPGLSGHDGDNRVVVIQPWERLAQLIILPIPTLKIEEVKILPKTVRGDKGFGSTGR